MLRWLPLLLLFAAVQASAEEAVLFDGRQVADVVHEDDRALGLAAQLLARDLAAITGHAPKVSTALTNCRVLCVVIGRHDSPLVRGIAREAGLDGQWERYTRALVRTRRGRILLIAGSDTRGSVWGVIDLTREIGVSAWEWWADVTPRRVSRLAVDGARRTSEGPSVRYRGIFLNDEDWGLQPWAAKNFEPEVGDIGPKTYSRIFELLWRLKANTIWPAMHDSTRPFYQIRGNAEAARDYAIVVGTSHAEPMMRNNVREWNDARGPFNWFENRDAMTAYWRERVEAVKGFENIYTIGLRGKHDSAMQGAETPEDARRAMTEVMAAQRMLLAGVRAPQVLTLYKEVLDIYARGLAVPDDVTLVWPDDNYGYIHQLPTPAERARSGGAGVYYHISYWGRPHDYLWLATTHPALIREQMQRAWATGADRLWIVNVGDIKPGEYLTQYFLELAFDHRLFDATARDHLERWAGVQFGKEHAAEIAGIMTGYYDLAWERRPEFMGWGQTEPTRPNRIGDYVRSGGGEALARIDRYAALTARAEALAARMPADRADAYFELVLYPVRAAASINARNLKLDLASLYLRQGNGIGALSDEARAAHARIVADTAAYNGLRGGKWRGIMDMAPRRLPVFDEPIYLQASAPAKPRPSPPLPTDRILSLLIVPGPGWETIPGLGSRGVALRARLDLPAGDIAPLTHKFEIAGETGAEIRIVALPVHPLTSANGLRLGVQLDDGAVQTLDFATFGRSEEWKRNVLSNTAVRSIALPRLAGGEHVLRLYALDPGLLIDRIEVRLDGAPDYYGAPPKAGAEHVDSPTLWDSVSISKTDGEDDEVCRRRAAHRGPVRGNPRAAGPRPDA